MNYQNILEDQIDAGIINGAVIMAGNEKETHFHKAFGEARTGVKMQLNSIFDLASITKPLATASACALCMDRGLLDGNKRLIRYLPECKGKVKDSLTVRQLATHTSGLAFTNFTKGTQIPEEVFDSLRQEQEPDTLWCYSCLEFILLGLLVERLTGDNLKSFCQRNIFAPIGMDETCFGPIECTERTTEPLTTAPGAISDPNAHYMSLRQRNIGNAGVFSTTADLARYCQMMLDGDNGIFSPEAHAKLTTNQVPISTIPPHSFGWNLNPDFRPQWMTGATIYHSGWAGNTVWIDMAQKVWFIILAARQGDYDKAKQGRLDIANCFSLGKHELT